jgi:hypothetical protein
MMQDIPNIARSRLRVAVAESRHPDADVLTAFAEKSLAERERGTVLDHLAQCRDCRDVVALALPELADTVAAPSVAQGWAQGWAWPAWRWGFALAGIAIVASFGLMQSRRHFAVDNMARLTVPQGEHSQTAAAPPSAQASQSQVSTPSLSSAPAASLTATDKNGSAAGNSIVQAPLSGRQGTRLEPLSNSTTPTRRAAPAMAPGAMHSTLAGMAGNTAAGGPMVRMQQQQQAPQQNLAQVQNERVQPLPGPISAGGDLQAKNDLQAKTTDEAAMAAARAQTVTVEVSGGAPLVQTETASAQLPAQPAGSKDSDYLIRAKPAMTPQPLPGAARGPGFSIPSWSISASGGVQRSYDQGKTWENVDVTANAAMNAAFGQPRSSSAVESAKLANHPKKQAAASAFRAVGAIGAEVWAGGLAGVLYHSSDAGAHWTQVLPASGSQTLSGDIVSIEFSDGQHGKIMTSSSEIWTTSDDGQTWHKQ